MVDWYESTQRPRANETEAYAALECAFPNALISDGDDETLWALRQSRWIAASTIFQHAR
jgi:hypothetical protein